MTDDRFLAAAEREFARAADRYQREQPGLGDVFDAVKEAAERAVMYPERGNPYFFGTRRIILSRFPYSLVYVVRPIRTVIVAVAHQRRRTGYWRKRLRSIH
ncbi:MAG: type II toxin-antitoxin system RelE/ParE family toxin [Gemmatimonadetes bacterium]|nr:type II toxin-antitoxin system RelE/ParE family toxin [Gemmatimonadota bacterium]